MLEPQPPQINGTKPKVHVKETLRKAEVVNEASLGSHCKPGCSLTAGERHHPIRELSGAAGAGRANLSLLQKHGL